jgi:hypothetical protein
MGIIEWWRWRVTRRRVAARVQWLLSHYGEGAFFKAHELAWSARSEGRDREAQFHKAVCYAIARHLQRRAVLAAVLAPATDPEQRANEAARSLHACLLRDLV